MKNKSLKFDGVMIIPIILAIIGVGGFIYFFKLCFGPCEHEWKYLHSGEYYCNRCHERKSQVECAHSYETVKNSKNWHIRKCRNCGKYETEKKF
ncbi:MAG: hypothetical protein HFJ30_00890 [Clostridia bacterium]|jgi:hypothetical protein|nr:hypothetical protein [Clostridia bacterium]